MMIDRDMARERERESRESMLSARFDKDDIYIYIYIVADIFSGDILYNHIVFSVVFISVNNNTHHIQILQKKEVLIFKLHTYAKLIYLK